MANDKILRAGLVGCGGLGRRHAKNADGIEGVQVAAVCDFYQASAQELAAGLTSKPAAYSDHRKMLAEQDLDAVLVVTPNYTHSEITIDAANAGVHVFCEKPMALTVEDCDAMIDAAERAGVFLMIGYVLRFYAANKEMKRQIDSGAIGEVRMAHALRLGTGPPGGVQGWQKKRDQYGGLFSLYSHQLDLLAWMAGEIASVSAVMRYGDDPENEIEENIFIGLEFANGAVGTLGCSRIYPVGGGEFGVAGTEGAIKSAGSGGPVISTKKGESVAIEVPRNDGLLDELVCFFGCIREGRKPESDGIAGRRVIAVALAAHESARTGRRVEVPHPRP
jgi:predicted dehydrogenase